MKTRILALTSAAMLLGMSLTAANALDVTVGGNTATATVGGGGGNVATVGVGDSATAAVTTNDGSLVDVQNQDGTTTGEANLGVGDLGLGGLLDGIDLGDADILPPDGGDGPGTAPPTQIAAAFTSLSSSDQQALKIRCRQVLMEPRNYDAQALQLCRLLVRIGQ